MWNNMTGLLKYALVTGASSGIGWHISRELAARGYGIIAVSNQSRQLSELKSDLEKSSQISVRTLDLDLSRSDAAAQVFDFCMQNNLRVEVLVNNAGILVYGEVVNTELEKVRDILQLHMNTPVMLCRLFGEQMVHDKKGYILNVSSISAVMPYPTIALYGPTKTLLRKFTRALRYEMKGSGVIVSCMLPGATATALYDTEKINVPLAMRLGIMQKPERVAKAGIKALFNNRMVRIPGMLNKFVVYCFPLIPGFLIGAIYQCVKKRNLKRSRNKQNEIY
jgi:short-subunit dehydrogenase